VLMLRETFAKAGCWSAVADFTGSAGAAVQDFGTPQGALAAGRTIWEGYATRAPVQPSGGHAGLSAC
jgi:hypothetical protein